MGYVKYKRSNSYKTKSFISKGVKTGRTTTYFINSNPYKVGMIINVIYKGSKKIAQIVKVNNQSVTVAFNDIDEKKIILYNNIVNIMEV